jgi:general secretion pathway protein H
VVRARARGLTLIEVLVTLVIIAIIAGAVTSGAGATTNARVRRASAMIAGAVRVAYARASATAKPVRLVLDLDAGKVMLEEGTGTMLVTQNTQDSTAGAAGETQEERDAIAETEKILKGPRAPRPSFRPVKTLGIDSEEGNARSVGRGVKLKGFESTHEIDGQTEGRAYLYFWPGGWTERAAIRIGRADTDSNDDGLTLFVSPLTGKVKTVPGQHGLETVGEQGEREDRSW